MEITTKKGKVFIKASCISFVDRVKNIFKNNYETDWLLSIIVDGRSMTLVFGTQKEAEAARNKIKEEDIEQIEVSGTFPLNQLKPGCIYKSKTRYFYANKNGLEIHEINKEIVDIMMKNQKESKYAKTNKALKRT